MKMNMKNLLHSLPEERIDDYLTWVYNLCGPKEGRWGSKKLHIFKFSSFEDMYEVASWSSPNRQEEEYQLKKGFIENNLQQILDEIDPNSKLFLMYSIDENPDWDMQEKLMNIATRYHLG